LLRKALEEAYTFCGQKGVNLGEIVSVYIGSFERVESIGKAVNALTRQTLSGKSFSLMRTSFELCSKL
jgi:hypothetical protein